MFNPLVALVWVACGYIVGRVDVAWYIRSFCREIYTLPFTHKGWVAGSLLMFIGLYLLLLAPLLAIASRESKESGNNPAIAPTSFRSEIRRRGSYSMNYINDIKSHVLARS
ncbi:hypothetical protein AeNC1_012421 [Aphanomyces euteiches]|uniref:Uncharacterized protein n=1 Tax=Aphanomyces euteiches TaxID=100861 RepID=A0A6G0X5S7_9STRA|nr:hypothetical protein Ae201684_008194 [Aphanomyces euteiches]KAH9070475.1 hypothetical protein Ae201684P_002833 [Aphanomyces euteiches]KAH9150974.1 hypothetical protein AeRB84_006306 [Aphanomyces euteiches]KAH9185605.1 hypothetical protein AeNC1_012421 [Aphanomyces euteiches]